VSSTTQQIWASNFLVIYSPSVRQNGITWSFGGGERDQAEAAVGVGLKRMHSEMGRLEIYISCIVAGLANNFPRHLSIRGGCAVYMAQLVSSRYRKLVK
jgi:hypothetical protein